MKEGIRMNLRAPAVPLITVDPYFSVWSMADHLAGDTTRHWTGKPNTLLGTVSIDGQSYGFMGAQENLPALSQTQISITALKTTYIFRQDMVELTATFLSPQLPDQLEIMSQPVSYLGNSDALFRWTSAPHLHPDRGVRRALSEFQRANASHGCPADSITCA